ncbi:MAG: hypothetical protein M1814_006219 [Vezdaea aestivalis]|nr:MAG: hypothetical protein M1814_006219 [Vezdaea aestivalis]
MPLELLYRYPEKAHSTSEEDKLVDIVAIHDLNGDPVKTWTDDESKVLWLRDLLPELISIGRVLSFRYNAEVSFYGTGSADRIQQQAQTLVADLNADRALEKCSRRPIIFLCHGVGGILAKKALLFSSTQLSQHSSHLYSIYTSTYAILFFGTPHCGAEKTYWPLSNTTERHIFKEPDDNYILSILAKDSEPLQMISEGFAPLFSRFRIFFFWEELATKSKGSKKYVVDEWSAAPMLSNTERSGIHADHFRMVQFANDNSSNYKTIVEALMRYSHDAPAIIKSRWKQTERQLENVRSQEALELTGVPSSPDPDAIPPEYQLEKARSFENKHFQIPQVVSSIFTGREEVASKVEKALFDSVTPKLSNQQRRYVVYGIGGSGKTQFCYATSAETAKESFGRIGKIGGLERTQNAGKHWLSHLEQPWLLIINNADDPNMNLEDLFPEGERGHVLITTRNPDFRIHATAGHIEFKGLERQEAVTLLLRAAELPSPADVPTEEASDKITSTLGYLALALIHAGALIRQKICKITNFLDFYNQNRISKSSVQRGNQYQYTVYSTWELALDSLEKRGTVASRDAIQILSIVAFFHFENIRIDIFTRAIKNRSETADEVSQKSASDRILGAIHSRIKPPAVLPDFLRQSLAGVDPFRIRVALNELRSFSLITYDSTEESFSLHPVIHAWAKDRIAPGTQSVWRFMALNTLVESVSLPPKDLEREDEDYRRDLLSHLDLSLAVSPSPLEIIDYNAYFGGLKFPFAFVLRHTWLFVYREQVLRAAKCGYVYTERGRFNDGALLLSRVKDALLKSRGPGDAATMRAMLALAKTYWGLGRLGEAIALQQEVVEACKKAHGPGDSATLSAMDQLGRSYWLNGQYCEALELQTLVVDRMNSTELKGSSAFLEAMDNLGVTLGSWQRYEESARIHQQVLEARKEKLGSTDLDTLTTMSNLAMALLDIGEKEKAKLLLTTVYTERKAKLGKEHPWTLWALCYLSKAHTELGLLKDAENMLVPGIEAARRSLSDDHLGVLMGCGQLARIYARQQRYEQAEELTQSTIKKLAKSRGPGHPDTVYALYKLAELYQLQDKVESAIETLGIAIERAKIRLTLDHPLAKKIEKRLASYQERLWIAKDG